MNNQPIIKYPRTPHIEGSKLQPGDSADGQMTIAAILSAYPNASFVSEEKLDGANSAFFFNHNLEFVQQSRGHVLHGGAREAQFNLFKQWGRTYEAELLERIEDRFRVYGEWCFAKHTQFYDALPHYLHEFDIWDMKEQIWLSTPRRHALLEGMPLVSVPVISTQWPKDRKAMRALVGKSVYRTDNWRDSLANAAVAVGVDPEQALHDSGAHRPEADLAEGLYIKIEDADQVLARFKYVRPGFLQTILESGSHWNERTIIANQLSEGRSLFAQPDLRHDPAFGPL